MLQYLEIGQIVNTFGIKGELKINPFTDDINRLDELKSMFVVKNKELIPYEIETVRYHKNMVILKLKGINSMNEAEKLKGLYIKIDRKYAKKLPKGTYFIADLIGLEVYDENSNLLGSIDDIYNTGANDIYVVKNNLGKQILLPGIPQVIKKVDLENKKIVVHLLNGLI